VAIPLSAILLLLVKLKVIYKANNEGRERIIAFYKKILIFGIILLPVSYWVKSNSKSSSRKRLYYTKNQYINDCFSDMGKAPYADSVKAKYIYSSYDYLHSKYGDSIYYSDFKLKELDKIDLGLILYFANHPKLTDSAKVDIRSHIKSFEDLRNINE
jgi:hypothetical protein